MRPPTLALALLVTISLAVTVVAQEAPPFTKLRHGHTIRMLCEANKPIAITLHAIAASVGYTDDTSYEIIGPNGQTLGRGVVPVGGKRAFTVTSPMAGCCLLTADPLRNAFGVEIEGAQWAVDVTDDFRIDVIDDARPLRFWLPGGMTKLTLEFSGEAATVQICGPRGEVIATQKVPQYEPVSATVDVAAGLSSAFWSLKLDLSEDLAISFPRETRGIITDYLVDKETFDRLLGMGSLSTFDRRPATAETMLRKTLPWVSASVRAGDLRLELGEDGSIVGLYRGKQDLAPGNPRPFAGFMARDVAAGSGFVRLEGKVAPGDNAARLQGSFPGLDVRLDASFASQGQAVVADGDIEDTTGKDRAISLYFILPVDAAGWLWHDDVNNSRPILAEGLYSNDSGCRAGANGFHSAYPLACLSGESSVAVGVNPTQPRIFRLGYEAATKLFFCVFDLGLSPEVRKSPSRAGFSLCVYPTDSAWGFRSAVEGYYAIYPDTFKKRIPKDGGWACWSTLEGIPDLDKTGMLYHWGPSESGIKHDDEVGAYSLIYNDSVRFFADIGAFEKRPTREQANERFHGFLDADDPLAFVLDAPEKATGRNRWLGLKSRLGDDGLAERARVCQRAVRNSHALATDGSPIPGYIINRKDWGPENWWTGRLLCNPDPDIPDGYGQFLLNEFIGLTWRSVEAAGAHPDGIGLDNYFVNANDLNYRREHFQYADIPLTFDRTGKIAICSDFMFLEWVGWLKDWLVERDCYLIPNGVRSGWPFFAQYMDIFGLEWGYQKEQAQFYHRTLARHRPVVTLPLKPEHYTEEWVKMHIGAGMMPGGYGGSKSLTDPQSDYRKILEKYMPVLQAMNHEGWEPVTHATFRVGQASRLSVGQAALPVLVGIERFGDAKAGVVYYAVRNRTDEPAEGTIHLDLSKLSLPGGPVEITNAVTGARLASASADSTAAVGLKLSAGDATVIKVATGQ